ncbi:MAG: HAD family hydrolase [Clostridiales bacterium]|nr:HAD family hydrolase [Clostridiales bacterium]
MIDTIVFDLDGTLLDTLDDLTAAVNHALTAFGLAPIAKLRVREFVGNGVPKLIERAVYFATTGKVPNIDGENDIDRSLVSACLALCTEYYDKHSMDHTAPYDGIKDMLSAVKDSGLKSAIVTNKYHAAACELKDIFFPTVDIIIGTQDGIRPKPAPDGVHKALELLGSDTAHAVYVGDGETDMKTAASCGMPAVAVTWGFRDEKVLRAFDPEFIIDKPSQLLDVLRDGGLIK